LNIYTHLVKPTNQEAACRLENAIWGEDGSKMVATKEKAIVARGHFSVVSALGKASDILRVEVPSS
jgi:hypothetical protein